MFINFMILPLSKETKSIYSHPYQKDEVNMFCMFYLPAVYTRSYKIFPLSVIDKASDWS